MRALTLVVLLSVLGACGGRPPTRWDPATSEAVRLLKADDDPYRIIYHPAVDLAKKPAGGS